MNSRDSQPTLRNSADSNRLAGLVAASLLVFWVPGCASLGQSRVAQEPTRAVDSDRDVLAGRALRLQLDRVFRNDSSPWALQLVSGERLGPAWLTGTIETLDNELTEQSPVSQNRETGRSIALLEATEPAVDPSRQRFHAARLFQPRQAEAELEESHDHFASKLSACCFDKSALIAGGPADDLSPDDSDLVLLGRIGRDHRNFYSPDSLIGLSYGLGGGALMANTSFDKTVQRHFQSSVRNASSDEWFEILHAPKDLGNGYYTIPAFAAAWAVGSMFDQSPVGETVSEWGERSFRSVLVGAPPMLATQYIIGGSRPGESTSGSDWKLFQDHNGVSGHSFMGAVPFLTAAQLAEDPWAKFALYAGSTLVPLSRINDGDHYASQAFLGWWFALLATHAVDATETNEFRWTFAPWFQFRTSGITAEYRF